MKTTELVLWAIGLEPYVLNWLDEISDAIDIHYSIDDICDAIAEMSDTSYPRSIGTAVVCMVMDKIKYHFKEKYPNFDEDKFGYDLNGLSSRVYYDWQVIDSDDDMDYIMEDEEAA